MFLSFPLPQLKRLVAILLLRGREYLPQTYLSVPAPSLDDTYDPPAQAARLEKPPSLSEVLGDDAATPGCLSSGPTPAPTPEIQRVKSVQSDEGAALSDSGSHVPESDVRVDGSAPVKGKREKEDRPMATLLSAVLGDGVRLSPPPKDPVPQRNPGEIERKQKESDDDIPRGAKKEGKAKSLPTVGIVHSVDPQQDTITRDEKSEQSVYREERKAAVAEDDDDLNDGDDDYGDDADNDGIDDGVTIGLAPKSSSAFDIGAAVDKANGKRRSEYRQKNNSNEEKELDKKREDEEDKAWKMEGLDEVTEMLEMVDSEDSKEEEMEETGVLRARGGRGMDTETDEIVAKSVRREETRTEPKVSKAADVEDAAIVTTAGRTGNGFVLGTLRQSTETPEEGIGQNESDDSTSQSPLKTERSFLPSGIRGIGHTDDENTVEIEVSVPEDKGAAAEPAASSSPLTPLPNPMAAVLAPPRSLSPSSLLPETGVSSASSLAGLPLPPVGGGRPRFGLLGSLPPVGGKGVPSLALRNGAGIGGVKRVTNSSDATTAVSGAHRSDRNNSAPPPPPPPAPGILGPSTRTEESLSPPDDASATPRRAYTGSTDSTRLSSILGDSPALISRGEGAAGGGVALSRSDPQGDDVEGVQGGTGKAVALPGSPRQHQGQEEEDAGLGSTEDAQGLGLVTVAGEKAQGEGQATNREQSGGYFGDSGGEVSEEGIPEVSSGDDDISFEQDSSDGAGAEGGDDDYFS